MNNNTESSTRKYQIPSPMLLDRHDDEIVKKDSVYLREAKKELEKTLESFGIDGSVSKIYVGPSVTRFVVALAPGVRVEKIKKIEHDIALALKTQNIRLVAPILGKDAVGIEVPNRTPNKVYLRSLLESDAWNKTKAAIPILLGRDVNGKPSILDLAKAPHLLIAGSSDAEKTACLNTLIMSMLFRFSPDELNILFISMDIERQRQYFNIPHMIIPPVKDNHDVWRAIQQAEIQIHSRYGMHYKVKAKNIAEFNSRPPDLQPVFDDGNVIPPKLPFLVVIVDELSHAMKGNNKEDAEYDICRIAQKGRAAGVHLVIATNSLRRFVVTGLIKANIPTKIAFRVGNVNASRLVLDCKGAEKLLGNGDMLFNPPCGASLERIQGAHVSEDEMRRVVDVVSRNAGTSG